MGYGIGFERVHFGACSASLTDVLMCLTSSWFAHFIIIFYYLGACRRRTPRTRRRSEGSLQTRLAETLFSDAPLPIRSSPVGRSPSACAEKLPKIDLIREALVAQRAAPEADERHADPRHRLAPLLRLYLLFEPREP